MAEAPDSGYDSPTIDSSTSAFRVDEVQGRAVVVASGEIDMITAPGLREALGAACQVSTRVVLDLTSVTFFDSSGVSVLVDALRQAHEGHRVSLSLAGATATVRRVLDITSISTMLPTYETLTEALEQSA